MEELINEMSYDLAECHVDYLDDAKLYTDYDTMAQKMVSRGYRKQSEWISVEDRLPEEDGWYITYTNAIGKSNGVITQQLVTTTIRGKKIRRWEWQTRVSPWIVTHWMPLPEPPEMKGGE